MDEQENASDEKGSVVVHPCLEGRDESKGENLDGDPTSGADALKDELRGNLKEDDSKVKETLSGVELVLSDADVLEKGLRGKGASVKREKRTPAMEWRERENSEEAVRKAQGEWTDGGDGIGNVAALELEDEETKHAVEWEEVSGTSRRKGRKGKTTNRSGMTMISSCTKR